MRVLFDVKHPAQVMFFKDAIRLLREQGEDVLVTSREKDETLELLDGLELPHVCISRMGRGKLGLGRELVSRTWRLLREARRFKPDCLVGRTGIGIAWVGQLLRAPSIVFDVAEFASLQIRLGTPFATVVCTGLGYTRRYPGKELQFSAPPHLAYTHPARFAPSAEVVRRHGINPDEPYAVMRVKSWTAAHDWGVAGPDDEAISRLADALGKFGRVVISSERPLPGPLERLRNPMPVQDALHLLAFARLYVGEGSTMAAESACLGTPAIYLSPESRRGYLDALEQRCGTVRTVRTGDEAIAAARLWLADGRTKSAAQDGARRLVAECEDPVEFTLNVIRKYSHRKDVKDTENGNVRKYEKKARQEQSRR